MFAYKYTAVTTSIFTIIIAIEYCLSLFQTMAQNDSSFLCYAIWATFLIGVLFAARAFKSQNWSAVNKIATLCTSLGLLGTVYGLYVCFNDLNIAALDPSDKGSVLAMMDNVLSGLNTSLTTTITGLIAAMALSLYPIFIRFKK